MGRRSSSPPGTPCFVGLICPDDAEPAKTFYAALLGWRFENIADEDALPFYVATLDGDRVASVAGSGNGEPGTWVTAVSVADREAAAAAVNDAGGSAPPGDTTEIPSIGRFHRVLDPAGAEIHLAQIDGTPVQRVGEPGTWSVSTLRIAEPGSVTGFYESVLGWRTEASGSATLCRLPGSDDVVAVIESVDGGAAVWRPDFRVADVDEAVRVAGEHGGRVEQGPERDDGVRRAVLVDPGGATFSVSQEQEPPG